MLTYWPGRNARSSRFSTSRVKEIVVSECLSSSWSVEVYVAAEVFADSAVAGIWMAMSDSGTAWQVSR